jgi:hypothetical protein
VRTGCRIDGRAADAATVTVALAIDAAISGSLIELPWRVSQEALLRKSGAYEGQRLLGVAAPRGLIWPWTVVLWAWGAAQRLGVTVIHASGAMIIPNRALPSMTRWIVS